VSIHALIAARLDTLPQGRKVLLQDAAVLGKVFWAGAVSAMDDRDRHEVGRALHELSRKELVRPSRQSSMEGEAEYGFWHLLVRDVAYRQIPRAQRAVKHLSAADWLEAKAGERVEDLAEVLAYHTSEALTLAQATADDVLQTDVAPVQPATRSSPGSVHSASIRPRRWACSTGRRRSPPRTIPALAE
jgi:predicted ATPase